MSSDEKSPIKQSEAEQSEVQTPPSAKKRRGRGSSALKVIEDGKAILKEMGFDDSETSGRRRTRASARGEVYTPPPTVVRKRKSAGSPASANKKAKVEEIPSSADTSMEVDEAPKDTKEESSEKISKDEGKETAAETTPTEPAKSPEKPAAAENDAKDIEKSESPLKPGELLTPSASPVKVTPPSRPTLSPIKPGTPPVSPGVPTKENDKPNDSGKVENPTVEDKEPVKTAEVKEDSPLVPPKPTPVVAAPELPPKPVVDPVLNSVKNATPVEVPLPATIETKPAAPVVSPVKSTPAPAPIPVEQKLNANMPVPPNSNSDVSDNHKPVSQMLSDASKGSQISSMGIE